MSTADVKAAVRERDGHRCVDCGGEPSQFYGKKVHRLDVHLLGRIAVMERNTSTVTCTIACESRETLRKVQELAKKEIGLEKVFEDVAVAYPGGVEERTVERHRLGDYFDRIQVIAADPPESVRFKLVFQPRQGAGRFWKDIMAEIVHALLESSSGVSVTSG